ncbi:MAG: hypothetical protein D6717_02095 [Gammaproteobacteria bacterium]|nr:MAG: hypothetical protein D6717_02095 [Gammaproteobacteria bacterium]
MNPRLMTLVMIVLAAALMRILPHPPNVTPVAAMALFAGAHFADRKLALVVPLLAMLMSDLVLGLHQTLLFVYLGVALTVLIGTTLRGRARPLPAMGAALLASVLFFLLTNFGVWLTGTLYPHTVQGLFAAYTAGLPFFRNSLLGDLFWTAVLFGGYRALAAYWPDLRETRTA